MRIVNPQVVEDYRDRLRFGFDSEFKTACAGCGPAELARNVALVYYCVSVVLRRQILRRIGMFPEFMPPIRWVCLLLFFLVLVQILSFSLRYSNSLCDFGHNNGL